LVNNMVDEIEELQKVRDEEFAKVVEEIKKKFHEKNILFHDAFMSVNQDIPDGYEEIIRTIGKLNGIIKYRESNFDDAEYRKQLIHLAIYAILNVMLADKVMSVKENK